MTSPRRNTLAGVACGLALAGLGCADSGTDDMGQRDFALRSNSGTVVQVLASDPNYSTLVAAVKLADLAVASSDPSAQFTALAPTNAAFEQALRDLGLNAEQLLSAPNCDLFADILLYH